MDSNQRRTLLDLLKTVDDAKDKAIKSIESEEDQYILQELRRLNDVTTDISEIGNSFFKQNSLLGGQK